MRPKNRTLQFASGRQRAQPGTYDKELDHAGDDSQNSSYLSVSLTGPSTRSAEKEVGRPLFSRTPSTRSWQVLEGEGVGPGGASTGIIQSKRK